MLHLKYTCTPEERSEAQNTLIAQQMGGGSSIRAKVILFLILGSAVFMLCWQISNTVPRQYQVYVWIGVVLVYIIISKRSKSPVSSVDDPLLEVQISESHLAVIDNTGQSVSPWSAFSEFVETEKLFLLLDRARTIVFMLPKRAFPDESALSWFREHINQWRLQTVPVESMEENAECKHGEGVQVKYTWKFRDSWFRTMASCFTWVMLCLIIGAQILAWVFVAREPSPKAVYSSTETFWMFMVPMWLFMIPFILFLSTFYNWIALRKYLSAREVTISEDGLICSDADGRGETSWSDDLRYKETRWCFLLWKPGNLFWLLIPKRAFLTASDLITCREMLARKVKYSRWFTGLNF